MRFLMLTGRMSNLSRFASLMLLLTGAFTALGQQNRNPLQFQAAQPDPQISAALKNVSTQSIQKNIEKLVSFGTRLTLSAQDPQSITAGHGIGAAREWIKSEFDRYSKDCGGCLEVKVETFTQPPADRVPQPTKISNVYAVMKGTDPERSNSIVVVTGHYDSRNSDTFDVNGAAPGANDDASGTAVSLECARVLSKLRFPGTIIFLTVAGEEQGLNGSKHFAEMARQQSWNIEAALNNDIVGGDRSAEQDTGVVRVFSEGIPVAATEQQIKLIRNLGGESDSSSRELARYIGQVSSTYDTKVRPMLVFRLDRYLRGGDHYSFNQQGFAAVRFTEFREDFNHQHQNIRNENGIDYGDLPRFVNYDYVAEVAKLNAATLASLASAPAPPANVRLLTKNLENDSTITWDASAGADAYEILFRDTASPTWDHSQLVGKVNRATMKYSKDNVIFAVRALDSHGHASLPVVPVPER